MITLSTLQDLNRIEELFHLAIQYQKTRSGNAWHGMDRNLIEYEIRNHLHWKILEAGEIACFFSIALTDRLVWEQRDEEPSVYLHRIVTNPVFRGRGYVQQILSWAEEFGRERQLQYVRLDTNRDNQRLNDYYREVGFELCGFRKFEDGSDPAIPRHYLGSGLSLFEKRIS
jgi:ribosomal protein S18 acetylase RimI-like enzyme